jgi:hypothetical protein
LSSRVAADHHVRKGETVTTTSSSADRRPANDRAPRRRLAAAAATGFLIIASFQVALALGAPLGAAAFGGAIAGQLPQQLRIASAGAAVVWFLAALIVLARGGFAISPLPKAVSRWGTWMLVGLLALATLLNLASSSPWERFGWGPFSLGMLILCLALARGGSGSRPGSRKAAESTPQ